MCRCNAARPKQTRDRQQEEEEELCRTTTSSCVTFWTTACRAAAANGFAWEQRSRAWKTSEAVEKKAADEVRRHYELLVEDMEVA
jgi:hypothetical protein